MAFAAALDAPGELVLSPGIVPFPRGFAFDREGRLFLASGIGPNGVGDNTIVAFAPGERGEPSRLSNDPNSARSIWLLRPTATSWCRASTPSAQPTPLRPFANTTPSADSLSASSLRTARPNFASREVFASGLTAISIALRRTRLSPSISRQAHFSELRCAFPPCTDRRSCFSHSKRDRPPSNWKGSPVAKSAA